MSIKKDTIFCMFCKKTVPVADFDDHEKSEAHQNIIKAKLGDLSIGSMMCKACMVPVNSEVIWNSHSKGRNHKKQVNFLHKVGKTEKFDRPFTLLEFDKDCSDPISDKMFSVVPDLFAPIIEEVSKVPVVQKSAANLADKTQTKPAVVASGNSSNISNDGPENNTHTELTDSKTNSAESNDISNAIDHRTQNKDKMSVRKNKDMQSRFDRKQTQRHNRSPMLSQADRNMQQRRGRDMGHHRVEEQIRREREEPPQTNKERIEHRNLSTDRKRKSKWDNTEKKVSKSDYDKIADEFLSGGSRDQVEKKQEDKVNSETDNVGSTAEATKSVPPFPPPPLFPPPGTMFPNIDPYAGVPPAFNPPPLIGMPPMNRMPFPPPMFPMPPPGLPIPPSSMPLPPSSMPLPPSSLPMPVPNLSMPPKSLPMPPSSLPMPSASMPITLSEPLPPPDVLPESSATDLKDKAIDTELKVNDPEAEEAPDRSHIDNTPKPSIPFSIEQNEVEIFIPEFFADRYPEHPHRGVVKADPEVALFDILEKERRAKEPIPESIHLKMSAKPILVVNEDIKPFNPDDYESLKGQVLPLIKPNQKFVVIGSNCLKVTGPNHFVCDLCKDQFNDASKMEHLLSKPHLLNILWNWDPDSAQMIKDIELLNKNLFDKKVMEAANEIQKKEIKLLSEHQLRIRARILDENVDEQNKYFIKNDVFDPANFPNHDFSYLNKEKEVESDDDEILSDDPSKTNKMKILEAGIMNMLKSTDQSEVVSDEDTALAALGICKNLMKKMEGRFKKCKHMPSEETVEKLKKVKHFFNNLLIIQQILDVYPSTAVKDNSSASKVGKGLDQTQVNTSQPAAFAQPAAFTQPAAFAQPAAFSQTREEGPSGQYTDYTTMSGFQNSHSGGNNPAMYNSTPNTQAASDPRRSKQADTGYSLYSTSVDQAGIEWFRQNKLS